MKNIVRKLSSMQYRFVLIYYSKKMWLMEGINLFSWEGLVPKKCDIQVGTVIKGIVESA